MCAFQALLGLGRKREHSHDHATGMEEHKQDWFSLKNKSAQILFEVLGNGFC